MKGEEPSTDAGIIKTATSPPEKRYRPIFEVPHNFFDSCTLLRFPHSSISSTIEGYGDSSDLQNLGETENNDKDSKNDVVPSRWTCNTCKAEFESLQDQRSHFKSDVHRFNVKLSIAGKNIVKEEEFDEMPFDSFKDYDVSSISGSEDETDKGVCSLNGGRKGLNGSDKQKLFIRLQSGEKVSVWKSLLMNETEDISYEDARSGNSNGDINPSLNANEVSRRLRTLTNEPRDGTQLRILLLASGGHFAGCVFDGNSVVAHKTFHRYVVRAKAGKKQSSKDASGKTVSSAGASLRRHNELALKKEIQELLAAWKSYFDASSCIYIYAPSNNRQLFFSGEKPNFNYQRSVVRNIPLTVRRPTYKEARRIYEQLIQVAYEVEEKESFPVIKHKVILNANIEIDGSQNPGKEDVVQNSVTGTCVGHKDLDERSRSSESENEAVCASTPLHEAAKSGNAHQVLDLLEQGLDPCIKDERGRTPYMLASEKEVRNTFRRFMASNIDKWDWDAAKVPSSLTREMEESQAAKQAEKDAKRKARAKELKKLKKAKEKMKVQADAAASQKGVTAVQKGVTSISLLKGQVQPKGGPQTSKEEELKKAQAAEREKRAAAAERRIAAAAAVSGLVGDFTCSCCNTSLAGKVPFHRYNFKYCSTSCMHVHREILEEEVD